MRLLFVVLAFASGCRFEGPPVEGPPEPGPITTPARFVDETAQIGLAMDDATVEVEHCDIATFMARAAAAADIDGDGDVDLFVPHPTGPDRMFVNVDGQYEPRPFDGAGGAGALFFDFDADGDPDLFVSSVGRETPRLYENDGGTFTVIDAGLEFGTNEDGCHHLFGASAADFDGDGDLDLFTAAWYGADGSRLFENDGNGKFTDRTEAAGLNLADAAGLVPMPIDLDEDGHLDLLFGADFADTRVFYGQPDHTFVERTKTSTLSRLHDLMGLDAADIDGDDDLDLYGVGICQRIGESCNDAFGWSGNKLFIKGDTGYVERTPRPIHDAGWAWGATFFDHDGDGDLDLVVATGYLYLPAFENQPVRVFTNDGTGRFEENATALGIEHTGQSRSVLPFDADGDQDLDLLILSADGPPRFFRNTTSAPMLSVDLADPTANGSVIRAHLSDGSTLRRDVHRRTTYLASRPSTVWFGRADEIVRIEITWPDSRITDYAPQRTLRID